jgi:hypothetical protein
MDPNTVLAHLLRSLVDEDREEVANALLNLSEWVDRDGFLPTNAYRDKVSFRILP